MMEESVVALAFDQNSNKIIRYNLELY